MKIILEDTEEEIRITVEAKKMPQVLNKLIDALKEQKEEEDFLVLHWENGKAVVPIEDIFYCESVEGKVYVYCENKVFTSDLKLYELESLLGTRGFMRISKQMIVDVRKIHLVSANSNAQLVATLKNDEKVVISRQFVPGLKERIGL